MPKIISEHCELVKLHHINRSGPGFSDTLYSTTLFVLEQELSYCCRGWPTVREQLKRLCLHRRCVEYLATGNFYLLA